MLEHRKRPSIEFETLGNTEGEYLQLKGKDTVPLSKSIVPSEIFT